MSRVQLCGRHLFKAKMADDIQSQETCEKLAEEASNSDEEDSNPDENSLSTFQSAARGLALLNIFQALLHWPPWGGWNGKWSKGWDLKKSCRIY